MKRSSTNQIQHISFLCCIDPICASMNSKNISQMKFFQLPLVLVFLIVSLRTILGHAQGVENGSRIRCLERERQALLKFKENLVDSDGRLASWGNKENKRECCKWRGVQCHNQTNHVIQLDLGNELGPDVPTLKGTISNSLLELQYLQYLNLSFNDFYYVPIPEFIGSLSELRYLDLVYANFGGPIPHHLGNLSKLLHLDLGYNLNSYSQSLDWLSHLHSLQYLDLSSINLSKATNWLQAINKLTSIRELHMYNGSLPDIPPSSLPSANGSNPLAAIDLSRNYFYSTLALIHWFSNFSSSGLTSIDLSYNNMPGPIPDVFENMASLVDLSLFEIGLEGGIPKYFGNMSNLIYLDLSVNDLTGELSELMVNLSEPIEKNLQYLLLDVNIITGSFFNMSRFSSLEVLGLGSNELNGSIQEGYLKLPHLLVLDLSTNRFTGPLPDLSFSSSLQKLRLQANKFNGTVTESIGRFSELLTLRIGSNDLEGTITEAFMSNLSDQLKSLDLSSITVKLSPYWVPPFRQIIYLKLRNCSLGPHFPLWLKTQEDLYVLDISSNGISDVIPSWFGSISTQLEYLNASNNQLHGIFPHFSVSTIDLFYGKIFDLSRNKILGSITFLCHIARDWKLIDLSDNLLSDQIPDCFAYFQRLEFLNLANNNLSGKIPHSFGLLCGLSSLHLRNNSFFGELPTSMGNCTNLKMIDIGENRLTGKVPTWIGDRFSNLMVLVLRLNEFYGNLPSNLCGLAHIHILDLSSNNISGVIPNCIHQYTAMTRDGNEYKQLPLDVLRRLGYPLREPYQLTIAYFMWKGNEIKYINKQRLVKLIDLSSNNLCGEIPWEIIKLVDLGGLNLSMNNLSGSIPYNIGQLKSLDSLDFSVNHLSGSIPTSLGELSFLGILNLSYNNLSGRIPPSPKLLTFDESAYMGNSGLCGIPLNKSCPGDEPHQDSNSNVDGNNPMSKAESDDHGFITKEFYVALGLGFVVGFWGIFGTILFNRAMRYAFLKVYNIIEDVTYVRVELAKAHLQRYFQNG